MSNTTKHTPGPWYLKLPSDPFSNPTIHPRCLPVWAVGAAGKNIDMPWDEVVANGRLMTAAPELLAACEAALAIMSEYHGASHDDHPIAQVMHQAEAAIAKARGE